MSSSSRSGRRLLLCYCSNGLLLLLLMSVSLSVLSWEGEETAETFLCARTLFSFLLPRSKKSSNNGAPRCCGALWSRAVLGLGFECALAPPGVALLFVCGFTNFVFFAATAPCLVVSASNEPTALLLPQRLPTVGVEEERGACCLFCKFVGGSAAARAASITAVVGGASRALGATAGAAAGGGAAAAADAAAAAAVGGRAGYCLGFCVESFPMALLAVLPRAPRCSGVWSLWVLFSFSGLLLGSLLLLGAAAAAAEPAASGSHAREAFESEQDGDELTISSGGTPGVEPPTSPGGPPQRGGGMRTGFVYYDDDSVDEEEGSETDEDGDDLVGAELQAEQEKAAEDAAGGEQGRPQLSMQVVLWCILSAAVYLIMRGASREDEKQKSLEVHKVLLGNTVKKLEADRAAAAALETHIQALTEEKVTREEQVAAAEKRLQTLVRDLQAAAAAGEEGLQQQQEKEAAATAATIGLPTLENTCREASRELQLLLLHLGDVSYTEEVARRSLQQLLADKQQLVQEKRDPPSGQQIPKEGDFLGALCWLEATATEWNVYGSRGDTKGGRERPTAYSGEGGEEARLRGRVVSLLGAAGLMLQRWQQLEGEAVAARAALQQQEEKVHQQVAESRQRAAALLQELQDCSNWAKLWSERVRSSLADGTTAGERFAAVAERVASTLQHVEFVFSHRGCTLQHQKASGSPKSAVAVAAATAAPAVVAAAATAEGSVPEDPGEVAEEVLEQLHSACGDVVEEAAAFKTAASESEEKQKIVEKEKQDLLDRVMNVIVKIGAFREQQIAAEAEQHIASITAAGLVQKHKLLHAPLDQTREWFANLQQTLNNISSSSS